MEKYELTDECVELPQSRRVRKATKLYRIRALRSFGDVGAGDLGGFVEKGENLSDEGLAWVYDDAKVFGDAVVSGDAQVRGEARVFDNARVCDAARVRGHIQVFENAAVSGSASVRGESPLAAVRGNAVVSDHAEVEGRAPEVSGRAVVSGNARVEERAHVSGNAVVSGHARVFGCALVTSDAEVCGNAWVDGCSIVSSDAAISKTDDCAHVSRALGLRLATGDVFCPTFYRCKGGEVKVAPLPGPSKTIPEFMAWARKTFAHDRAKEEELIRMSAMMMAHFHGKELRELELRDELHALGMD